MIKEQTVGTVLFTQEEIWQRATELGKQISEDYAGEELILIGTLKGAVMWMTDLMKNITLETKIDFVSASSYGMGTVSSGMVKIKKDINTSLTDKNVMIIEDIVDTGNTLQALREYFNEQKPKSIAICTLLDKPSRRVVDVPIDYKGFTVDDLFIIGYGLDFAQRYRNLPYISYLED